MTDLTIFTDTDRFIIGRRSDQTCYSMTTGVAEAYTKAEARRALNEARQMTEAQLEAAKRTYWTDGRFESACEAGRFGAEW